MLLRDPDGDPHVVLADAVNAIQKGDEEYISRYISPIIIRVSEHEFLSNDYPVDTKYRGRVYPSATAAYEAKKKGISKEIDKAIMFGILRKKFENRVLRNMIADLNDKKIVVIIADNIADDEYWGYNPKTKSGENVLGTLLTQARIEARYDFLR